VEQKPSDFRLKINHQTRIQVNHNHSQLFAISATCASISALESCADLGKEWAFKLVNKACAEPFFGVKNGRCSI
jgi:hypothetical protein